MVPDSVIFDKKLPSSCVHVYAYLAGCIRRGNAIVSVGQRQISRDLGMSVTTVNQALAHLESRSHIEVEQEGNLRARYLLCSNIFRHEEWSPRNRKGRG